MTFLLVLIGLFALVYNIMQYNKKKIKTEKENKKTQLIKAASEKLEKSELMANITDFILKNESRIDLVFIEKWGIRIEKQIGKGFKINSYARIFEYLVEPDMRCFTDEEICALGTLCYLRLPYDKFNKRIGFFNGYECDDRDYYLNKYTRDHIRVGACYIIIQRILEEKVNLRIREPF